MSFKYLQFNQKIKEITRWQNQWSVKVHDVTITIPFINDSRHVLHIKKTLNIYMVCKAKNTHDNKM